MELVPLLLRQDGFDYFLSDRLNQDPVEEHFNKQRSSDAGSEMPLLQSYGYNKRKVIVSKSDMIQVMHSNTRGSIRDEEEIDIHDDRSLPKKAKRAKKD